MDDLIADFLAETRVELDRVGDALTRIDRGAALSENAHDLKKGMGAIRARAGALGLARVTALAEAFEQSLGQQRHHPNAALESLRAMERAYDRISRLIAMIAATGAEPAGGDPDLIAAFSDQDGEARVRAQRLAGALEDEACQQDDPWLALERTVGVCARQMRKNIALTLEPSARALPPLLVHALAEPLSIVLRHACVYSLEIEVLRRARDKRAAGSIRVSGLTVGAEAMFAVSDDGAGLDLNRLRARAVSLKQIKPAEAAAMSDSDAAALVFHPGISSYGEGAGAPGLDSARDAIVRLGGAIEVNSLPGRGATFLIRMPMPAHRAPIDFSGAEDEKLSRRR